MTKILDGKSVADTLYSEMKKQTGEMDKKPCLAVILVGDDPASHVYVGNKEKSCAKAGIDSKTFRYSEDATEVEILEKIEEINQDDSITGMIVQVPLPNHISEEKVLNAILPEKDMDGFHPNNLGNVFLSKHSEYLPPATPRGIVSLLEEYGTEIEGKNVVVLGRSNTVGKPIATMLLNRNATVTVCHSRTKNLEEFTRKADIIIAAVGIPKFLKEDMVSDGVIIIDVGIHRTDEGGLCGDVDFDAVYGKCAAISPVPGGVGPMTVASLIQNTFKSFIA